MIAVGDTVVSCDDRFIGLRWRVESVVDGFVTATTLDGAELRRRRAAAAEWKEVRRDWSTDDIVVVVAATYDATLERILDGVGPTPPGQIPAFDDLPPEVRIAVVAAVGPMIYGPVLDAMMLAGIANDPRTKGGA